MPAGYRIPAHWHSTEENLTVLSGLLGMGMGDRTMLALSGVFSNGVGIGIPFITYAFGEQGLVPLLMIISVHSLILLTFSSFLMEMDAPGGARRRLLGRLGGAAFNMLNPSFRRSSPVLRGASSPDWCPASRRRP
jgi:hypothetical protein